MLLGPNFTYFWDEEKHEKEKIMKKWSKVEDFAKEIFKMNVTRKVKLVVVHHTYIPNHKQWQGDKSANGVLNFWKKRQREEGWSAPPGGHFLVAPKGELYLPFDLSKIINANSDRKANRDGVAIETVGNFDAGHDKLEGTQRHSLYGLIGLLLAKFNLLPKDIYFHRSFPAAHKSCPGTSLNLDIMRKDIESSLIWAKSMKG